jgi:hypothetical protein
VGAESQKAPDTLQSRGLLRSSVVALPAVLTSPGFPERVGPFQSHPWRLTNRLRVGLKGASSALRADCSGDLRSPGGWLNDVRKSEALAQPIRNLRFLRTADDVSTATNAVSEARNEAPKFSQGESEALAGNRTLRVR